MRESRIFGGDFDLQLEILQGLDLSNPRIFGEILASGKFLGSCPKSWDFFFGGGEVLGKIFPISGKFLGRSSQFLGNLGNSSQKV